MSYNATDSTPAGIKHTHEIHQKITENHKIKIAITAHTAKGPIARFSITSSDLLDLHFILVHTVTHNTHSKVNETRINTRNFHRGFG